MTNKQVKPTSQLIVFMVSKVGMRDAVKVGTLIVQWGVVARKLKREPSWPEYCAYWRESRATYMRELRLLRKVWPGDKNPQRVWSWVEGQVPMLSNVSRATVDDAVAQLFVTVPA